jgi:hypothetical protein
MAKDQPNSENKHPEKAYSSLFSATLLRAHYFVRRAVACAASGSWIVMLELGDDPLQLVQMPTWRAIFRIPAPCFRIRTTAAPASGITEAMNFTGEPAPRAARAR